MSNHKFLIFLLIGLFLASSIMAQDKKPAKIVKPILVDKTTLSGIGLKPVKNKNEPDRKLFQRRIFWGKDLGVFVVSSETATANHKSYGIEEFLYIANGRARVKPNDVGVKEEIYSTGDFFVVPKGFAGEWETQGGNKYHYELSVISSKRSGKESFGQTRLPYLLDKAKLSGIGLTKVKTKDGKEYYRDTLFRGIELSVILESEEGMTRTIERTTYDQMLYVIAGQVEISTGEDSMTFKTGDFFILPRGFSGTWTSKGHHLFRTLKVIGSQKA